MADTAAQAAQAQGSKAGCPEDTLPSYGGNVEVGLSHGRTVAIGSLQRHRS